MNDALTSLLNTSVTLAHGGLKIEESVLLTPGWVFATQDDGIDTYLGPLADMPINPKFSKMKLPRDLFTALTAPPRYPVPHTPAGPEVLLKYERYRL